MVKFSKQFEGQLIPEWKEAFVDYWQLKKGLKKYQVLNNTNNSMHQSSSVPKSIISSLRNYSLFGHQHRDHGTIQVHRKLASSTIKGDIYETELLEQFADTDATKEFFACLDQQLNKVNKFYRTKEEEYMERGDSLKKQMEILLELKSTFMEKHGKEGCSEDSKEDQSISCTFSNEEDSVRNRELQEEIQETSTDDKDEVPCLDSPRADEFGKSMQMKREDGKMRTHSGRIINCKGKNLRINIPLTTPSRTFSSISYLVWEDLLNQSSRKCGAEGSKVYVNKTKLHHAEKMIKGGFV
ncbi:hypothetical protein TanjilG_15127 [Lupinus angustifolius]|uniref:SPX domain-containing protein n=1 Tax=Lupinus angustifolius TaxID=3871 RepID=A0A1J7GP96_LUPAN|nr:hypothetical protein TanjilG_15127 [Lupinus angustifolius]